MKFRIISIIFAGLLVLAAVGCGSPEFEYVDTLCYNCASLNALKVPQGTPVNGIAASCEICDYTGYVTKVRLELFNGPVEFWIIYAY